jgi:type IV pilus assembly protein PilM
MVIQLGGESSILNIVKGDTLLLQRTVPYGTNAVVQEVMDERNVDAATAMTLLQNERMITVDFDDNEITGAFRYLMNNIGRVMDYYASKNPDKPIDDVYLTGDGALIRGIEGLFKIQLNISTKIMDSLYNVKFDPSINMQIYNPVYLIASIGAAFAPMKFEVTQEKAAKTANVSSDAVTKILMMVTVVVVIACVAGIVITNMMKQNAEAQKSNLEQQIAAIQDIENVITEYEATESKVSDLQALYDSTITPNEQMLTLIEALEEKMPTDATLSALSCSADSISFTVNTPDYDSMVKFIMQAKSISCIENVFTSGFSPSETGENDEVTSYTSSFTCNYATNETADVDISTSTAQ